MIHQALGRPVPVELTDDPRVRGRVKRLSLVSAVMLGLIWTLAVATLQSPYLVGAALFAGWILMPVTLLASLHSLSARYWLVLPSTLVSLGLLGVVLTRLPGDPVAASGWLLMLAGVTFGGGLGLWLWFRVLPVPERLDDPTSRGRWALIGGHVSLVVAGAVLVATAAVST
ncbi:MAG: hypothetical protein PVG27_00225 [Chloroflexota bacterium]|jgi:hypothetical protein